MKRIISALVLLCMAGCAFASYVAYWGPGGATTVSMTPGPNPGVDKWGRLQVWGRPFYCCYNNAAVDDDSSSYVYFAVDHTSGRNVVANGAHVVCYSGAGSITWIPWPNLADSVTVVVDSDITKRQAEYWWSGKLFGARMADASGTTGAILEIW